jgi:outer membrane protein assembly factor BamB
MSRRVSRFSRRTFLASTASGLVGLGVFGNSSATGSTVQAQQTVSGNWTQRGANAASTSHLANGVGPTGNVKRAWEDSLSRGRNNDGVAVVGNTVYTAGGDLRALNVADGSERWSFSPTVPDLDYPEGAGADVRRPAVMNGTVYVPVGFEVYDTDATQHTALVAVDAKTGKKRWRIDSDGLTQGIFSPVTVANGLVYTSGPALKGSNGNNGGSGGLYAFDANTGKVRWQRRNSRAALLSLPIANGRAYLPEEGNGVLALDAATGTVLWKALPRVNVGSTPMVAGETLFVTEDDSPGVTLITLDAATGKEQWRTAYPSSEEYPDLDVGTVDNERVYIQVSTIDADVIALDRTNGNELWRAKIPQPPETDEGPVTSVPTRGFARVGNLLYVGGAALNPANGAVVWTYKIKGPLISRPFLSAVAGGRVYLSGDRLIVVSGDTKQKLDVSTGTPTTTPATRTKIATPTRSTETRTRSPTQNSSPTQTPASPTQTPAPTQSSTQTSTQTTPQTPEQTTAANGPGFGVLTTVAGAGLGAWRYLRRD